MRFCIIGIGGCGGKLTARILENQDTSFIGNPLGKHICFGDVKGMWLEADVQETKDQKFFLPLSTTQNTYRPFYYIPHDILQSESRTSRLLQMKYGYDLKKQGFFRQAEYLKAISEIFDVDKEIQKIAMVETGSENPVLESIWANVRPYTTLAGANSHKSNCSPCDGILFVVSLGGGTGTGFINPITKYIRKERSAYPVFVLGVLTERGRDIQQNTDEPKRDLSAVISMHDLLTKARGQGIDGLILIDNQLLKDKFDASYSTMDGFIRQSLMPMFDSRHYPGENPPSLAVRELFMENSYTPPIIVPCYSKGKDGDPVEDLVKTALIQGKLFGCEPRMAEKIFIFSKGFINSKELLKAVSEQTELAPKKIAIWRKIGNNHSNEVLILLKNPYGVVEAFREVGTVEHRIHEILMLALRYIDENRDEILQSGMTERTNLALEAYFYGKNGLKYSLQDALSRTEQGIKPIFQDVLNIFGALDAQEQDESEAVQNRSSSDERKIKAIFEGLLKEKGLIKENDHTAL
jgi:hypothetical protein